MKRLLICISAAAALLFAASAAEASRIGWSIGVNVPPVATYVSNGPGWGYAPPAVVYSTPAPYYAPAPVVYDEPYFVRPYAVPRVGYYAPYVVAPRHRHYWAHPHWVDRAPWHRHDRWHHRVDRHR